MGNGTPLPVSLVIPAFRAEATIAHAVASVLGQGVVPAEIIVVDDASPDRTAEVAAAAGARVIRLERNGGPSLARNRGAAAAQNDWIAFLDADDVWLDGKLAAQWVALCRWPDTGWCFTDYHAIYPSGWVVEREGATHPGYGLLVAAERFGDAARFAPGSILQALVRSMFVRQSSVVVKRALFEQCGGFDPGIRLAEDYDLLLRLSALAPVAGIDRGLVSYRRFPDSLSADPLAELGAIDRLWDTILARPEGYPPAVVALIRAHRAEPLRTASAVALRLGRFAEAAVLARRAHALERSPATFALETIANVLDTPVGAATFRTARQLWRARPLRSESRS